MTAVIFDCDGVLADTERWGHLPAFNQTFREFGVPVEWSVEDYRAKLRIAGGKERMASLLTPEFVAANGLPADHAGQAALVAEWHSRKTEIYTRLVTDGRLPPRPGVQRIVAQALDAGWTLAVASTSAERSVRAILDHAVGTETANRFELILAGDVVPNKKPAPDIYRLALERLDMQASRVLVVEDSNNGIVAATTAGLRCVMTVNGYTEDEDNRAAILVVTSLGDPDGEQTRVIANRSHAHPEGYVTLSDLEACLTTPAAV